MDNFLFSLNATVPIFLIMVLGWWLTQKGFLNKNFLEVANKYVFKIALPVQLFLDIAKADIRSEFEPKFFFFCMFTTIIMFLGVWAFSYLVIRDRSMTGAFAQAAARGSAAVLGVAFVENIYGNAGMAPMMIVAAVPLYNVFAVLILTFGAPAEQNLDKKERILSACKNVAKNPIILGILAGLPFSLLGITIPAIPLKAVTYISNTSTPIALLAIGGGFEGRKAIKKIKPTLGATFIKLVGLPGLFLPLALYFGFTGPDLVAILIMLGSPTTVACYVMAKNMGNDEVLTSSIVVMATLLSSVTLTMWIFIVRSLGYI